MKVSIIVPAYNEELRIKPFLNDLRQSMKSNWEVIFVNDGSKDSTLSILKKFKIRNKKIISYYKNKGKGFAVKMGIMDGKGDYIIFIDADNSIHPSQIDKMLKYLKKYEIVVGNRASKDSSVKQPLFRQSVGKVFNIYTTLLFFSSVRDNLCGFKGFRKKIAKSLFKKMVSNGWIFDVELFYRIKKRKYSLYKMPIKWEHREKSKMKINDIIKILFDMLILRIKLFRYR